MNQMPAQKETHQSQKDLMIMRCESLVFFFSVLFFFIPMSTSISFLSFACCEINESFSFLAFRKNSKERELQDIVKAPAL
jgi:hypothetical protein